MRFFVVIGLTISDFIGNQNSLDMNIAEVFVNGATEYS